jgi:preprotein translocase subunit SecA
MLQAVLTKIFGTKNDRELKKMWPRVAEINALEPEMEKLTDEQLKGKTAEFKQRLADGATVDDLLPEAFAVVRETSKRVLGMRPFDVQLLGGMVLHSGRISEMRTGEGKTLVATLPVYLNALEGKGVHVVTVNDYLAERDSMGRGNFKGMSNVYGFLGMTTGVIKNGMSYRQRKDAYACDITYCTNNELGFDYLRDNMATHPDYTVQRELHYAIVDEVDSILVDEARTPLIISGPSDESTDLYYKVDRIIPSLRKGEHYEVEEKTRSSFLTEKGVTEVEHLLGVGNLYDHKNVQLVHYVQQALKAHAIFKLDVDYIVKDGEVLIVDEFTGRLMPGRRYSDGLHQALEAKEHVKIEQESQTYATITFQNFFRMYKKLSGMTGTAETEAAEFRDIYKLDVMVVPTHRPMVRLDESDQVYRTETEKWNAIAQDIADLHTKGQPVLVGTVSIDKNEKLSEMLKKRGVKHEVLNAKQHEREADIIALAGQPGAVTIATNMAGRGTDIQLGPGVKELGGLAVLGTERHESRRIDNQLRGRSGRQGDPGLSRFYVSLEDDLMRIFGSDRLKSWMTKLGMQEGEVISHPWVSKAIERSQKAVEGHNFDIRKHLLEYDDVMNKQREVIYSERNRVLHKEDIREHMQEVLGDAAESVVLHCAPAKNVDEWDIDGLLKWFKGLAQEDLGLKDEAARMMDRVALFEYVKDRLVEVYQHKETVLTPEVMRPLERSVLLEVVDMQWKDHLLNMDHMKEGIGLQAYGQKDPLIEYKRQGYDLFQDMLNRVKEESVRTLLMVQSVAPDDEFFNRAPVLAGKEVKADFSLEQSLRQEAAAHQQAQAQPQGMPPGMGAPMGALGNAPWEQGGQDGQPFPTGGDTAKVQTIRRSEPKVGRNDPCPCGSGKKYKKCHGA